MTSNTPIIDEDRSSLGRKAIESLKEIERNRHLHLCQQGSFVSLYKLFSAAYRMVHRFTGYRARETESVGSKTARPRGGEISVGATETD